LLFLEKRFKLLDLGLELRHLVLELGEVLEDQADVEHRDVGA
jgi:hypothetical protein